MSVWVFLGWVGIAFLFYRLGKVESINQIYTGFADYFKAMLMGKKLEDESRWFADTAYGGGNVIGFLVFWILVIVSIAVLCVQTFR